MSTPTTPRSRPAAWLPSTATLGFRAEVWDYEDGCLEPSLACRWSLIRAICAYRPDLVLTHRPNDYHPDHRATSQVVQDAAYLLTVPAVCPDVPHLDRDPVIAYLSDDILRPCPFEPTVVLDVTPVWDAKIAMLNAHPSQFYEWLPFNGRYAQDVPDGPEARRAWLSGWLDQQSGRLADRFRNLLISTYGPERGPSIQRVEASEVSEYGYPADRELIRELFPHESIGENLDA